MASSSSSGDEEAVDDPARRKGDRWTAEEDELLLQWVARHGARRYNAVALALGRTYLQVYRRWKESLDPALVRSVKWSAAEDAKLTRLHDTLGNRWSRIAKQMPGRSAKALSQRRSCLLIRSSRATK